VKWKEQIALEKDAEAGVGLSFVPTGATLVVVVITHCLFIAFVVILPSVPEVLKGIHESPVAEVV